MLIAERRRSKILRFENKENSWLTPQIVMQICDYGEKQPGILFETVVQHAFYEHDLFNYHFVLTTMFFMLSLFFITPHILTLLKIFLISFDSNSVALSLATI